MPFTAAEFVALFGLYNDAVWPAQLVLNALAFAAVAALLWLPRASAAVCALLALLWAWTAIAYHFAFLTRINPAAWGFSALALAGALAFAWFGVVRDRLRLRPDGGVRGWLGGVMITYALVVYPLLGAAFGQRYPLAPTFGLPCPTTIFTLGMLMFAAPPAPRIVFVAPLLWSAIGTFAALRFGIVQDLGLLAAGLLTLAVAATPSSVWPVDREATTAS